MVLHCNSSYQELLSTEFGKGITNDYLYNNTLCLCILKRNSIELGMVAYVYNLRTLEAEAGGLLLKARPISQRFSGQLGLYSENLS